MVSESGSDSDEGSAEGKSTTSSASSEGEPIAGRGATPSRPTTERLGRGGRDDHPGQATSRASLRAARGQMADQEPKRGGKPKVVYPKNGLKLYPRGAPGSQIKNAASMYEWMVELSELNSCHMFDAWIYLWRQVLEEAKGDGPRGMNPKYPELASWFLEAANEETARAEADGKLSQYLDAEEALRNKEAGREENLSAAATERSLYASDDEGEAESGGAPAASAEKRRADSTVKKETSVQVTTTLNALNAARALTLRYREQNETKQLIPWLMHDRLSGKYVMREQSAIVYPWHATLLRLVNEQVKLGNGPVTTAQVVQSYAELHLEPDERPGRFTERVLYETAYANDVKGVRDDFTKVVTELLARLPAVLASVQGKLSARGTSMLSVTASELAAEADQSYDELRALRTATNDATPLYVAAAARVSDEAAGDATGKCCAHARVVNNAVCGAAHLLSACNVYKQGEEPYVQAAAARLRSLGLGPEGAKALLTQNGQRRFVSVVTRHMRRLEKAPADDATALSVQVAEHGAGGGGQTGAHLEAGRLAVQRLRLLPELPQPRVVLQVPGRQNSRRARGQGGWRAAASAVRGDGARGRRRERGSRRRNVRGGGAARGASPRGRGGARDGD